jgi:hypothetical protein
MEECEYMGGEVLEMVRAVKLSEWDQDLTSLMMETPSFGGGPGGALIS